MLVRVRTSKKGAANAVKEDPPLPTNVVRLSCELEKGRVGNQKKAFVCIRHPQRFNQSMNLCRNCELQKNK
jgi:hypothetical protein